MSIGLTEEQAALASSLAEWAADRGFAEQVRAARSAGADAWGWLPEGDDGATLMAYAEGLAEPLLLVPEDEPALADAVGVQGEVVPVHGGRARGTG